MRKNFTCNDRVHPAYFHNRRAYCTRCGEEYPYTELVHGHIANWGGIETDEEYHWWCRNDNCYGYLGNGIHESEVVSA